MKTSLLLAAVGCAATLHAATPSYETQREITSSGDFNADGNPDTLILDKVTGLYRIGYGTGLATTPNYANARPTGVAGATSVAVGKINGTVRDSFAVTAPDQNRLQIISPLTTGYIEPLSFINPGISPTTMCAIDITTGPSATPEDDLAVLIADHPTFSTAISEVRSNAGSWSIIDTGDCPTVNAGRKGNPIITSVGGTALFAYIVDDGATNSFFASDPTGAGYTDRLTASGLPDNASFITVPFQVPNMDVVFYVQGTDAVHVRRITASGPGWVFGPDDVTNFGIGIEQVVPIADPAGARMLARFSNGSVAIYGYSSASGFTPPTPIAVSGASGVLSGIVPVAGASQFQLLYAPAAGQPSTVAVTFANNGSGWTQTGVTTLPKINVYSSYANILLLSNAPFRDENVSLLRSYKAGDWTTGVSVGGGPFTVTAQAANYLSMTQGIGSASAQNVGTAAASAGGTAVNQQHPQFSIVSFETNLGPVSESLVISPLAGTYSSGIQITFSGYSGGSTVKYRLGSSGAFSTYNASSPPWVFTSGTVYFYADKPGTGPTPTQSATYAFSRPPALQDKDGDGVPDFVEVAKGLDPSSGADSDGDGFSDKDEIAAGSNPNNSASTPANDAPSLGTLVVDASVKMESTSGSTLAHGDNSTVISLFDPMGNAVGTGTVGSGGAATYFTRITALNATGDRGYFIARTPVNYVTDPTTVGEHRGREMAAIIPLPEEDGWSFGATQGTLVTTGTTWSWGGTNWVNTTTNWNAIGSTAGYDDHWSSAQQSFTFAINGASAAAPTWLAQNFAAANRGGQPYVNVTLTPETTLAALIVREMINDLFIARGTTPSGDGLTLTGIVSPRDLRSRSSTAPTAPVVRVASLVSTVDTALKGADAGATALRKLARDVFARSQALADVDIATLPSPMSALHDLVTTGALPTAYQTGSGLTSTEVTDATTKLTTILGSAPARTTSSFTLYTRSSASPAGLTLVENSTGSVYALYDSNLRQISMPTDVTLPAGTTLLVDAFTDLPAIGGYTSLEVTALTVLSLPTTIDADTDGDLIADSWELRHFGTLALGTYDHGDGSAYSLGEEYFRSTDPRDASSSPAGAPTTLDFVQFTIDHSGSPTLRATWPAAYASFINVDFQASEDLLSWAIPSGFSATDTGSGVFTKVFSYDRPRRFFRPVASLKR